MFIQFVQCEYMGQVAASGTELGRCDIHSFDRFFLIHTYFDYNKLLAIVRGRKKKTKEKKEQRKNMKLHFFF